MPFSLEERTALLALKGVNAARFYDHHPSIKGEHRYCDEQACPALGCEAAPPHPN